jgi:hypothetical protein
MPLESPTATVVTATVAEELPAATVTLDGTAATPVFEEYRATLAPPAGAGPFKTTVAVDVAPPTALAGEKETL